MRVLILEPLESEVIRWLSDRHDVVLAPELVGQAMPLAEALAGAHGLIVPPSLAVDTKLLRCAPHLRVVGRVSAGAENLNLEACRQAGVELVRSNMASANAEAEFIVGALLALLRRVPVQGSDGLMVGRELGCSTVGLVGMSAAARVLGQLLPVFGTRVLGYDPSLHPTDPVWGHWGVEPVTIRELMEQSDGVCVQLPYFPRYRGLIGERVLALAKTNQVLVSISHSAIFDDAALAEAMHSQRILAAWLDSVEPGLLEPGHPLHGAEGLQVTPRLASTTRESRARAAWTVAKRVDEILTSDASPPAELEQPSGFAQLPVLD